LTIYISQGSVATQLRCSGNAVTSIIQIFHRMCRWKNFENWSINGVDMDKSMWLSFFGPPCIQAAAEDAFGGFGLLKT